MQPGDTVSRSPLYKPLHQLTEDDISQLTREDCRRFLKEKGMRRPSWNKSQAIQQVISLKTLLETALDSDGHDARRRLCIPRSDNPQEGAPADFFVSAKETSGDAPISAPHGETVLHRRHDPPKLDFLGDPLAHLVATENDWLAPRTMGAANEPIGQMTIFYCGKVNVYDDVPTNKAQAIMQLASCPFSLSLETSPDSNPTLWPIPCQLETQGVKTASSSPMIFPTQPIGKVAENRQLPKEDSNLSHDDSLEGPTSRKASVQRYLEKRKDRFKNKRKVSMPSCTSSDIYSNHQVRDQFTSNQWNLTDACSTPHHKTAQTPTQCSSDENVAKHSYLSADLNDKDGQECSKWRE